MGKRIVVTGMGMISPLGGKLSECWNALIGGREGFSEVTLFDTSGCRCHRAGQVEVSSMQQSHFSRATRLALQALEEALSQAGLLRNGVITHARIPWCVSTTGGAMSEGEVFFRKVLKGKPRQLHHIGRYQPQQQMEELQDYFGARGHVSIVANACASGANAIGQARDWIRAGHADCVIAGGYEALSELIYVGFDCLHASSPTTIRPFDCDRDGLLLGEGAGFLVLEAEEHALKRGVPVVAELSGYGHTMDLSHLTRPDPEGQPLVRAMQQALREAKGVGRDIRIGYVNAHGTATPANDGAEAGSLLRVLGEEGLWRVSSTKASIGHTLGAAGSVEALFALQALQTGILPQQIGTQNAIPEISRRLARKGDRLRNGDSVASVNLGFGGANACLLFTEYEERSLTGVGKSHANREGRSAVHEVSLAWRGWARVHPEDTGEEPSLMSGLNEGERSFPVWRISPEHPAVVKWNRHPRLRRSTPLARFMVAACDQALSACRGGRVDVPPERLGLVAALGTGSVQASSKFFRQILSEGQSMASPAVFPETVYNSPVSHVAAALEIKGPVDSLVGDESSWVTALLHADSWLKLGTVDAVLVCAGEELAAVSLEAYRCAGWFRNPHFLPAEGAAAVLLTRADEGEENISGVEMLPVSRTSLFRPPRHSHPFAFTCSPAWDLVERLECADGKAPEWTYLIHGSNFRDARIFITASATS